MNSSNTARETEKEFVEISEDAYKQNSVYRPWTEIKAKEQAGTRHNPRINAELAETRRSANA